MFQPHATLLVETTKILSVVNVSTDNVSVNQDGLARLVLNVCSTF